MTTSSCPAARLEPAQRMDIETLAKDANLSKLASTNDVSRKYLYQQKGKARDALQEAFAPSSAGEEVLFSIPVTSAWLDQFVVSLTLTCHSSYRGVVQFVRDLLGVSISLGSVHNLLQRAAKRASQSFAVAANGWAIALSTSPTCWRQSVKTSRASKS